jgi:hypothetical protein
VRLSVHIYDVAFRFLELFVNRSLNEPNAGHTCAKAFATLRMTCRMVFDDQFGAVGCILAYYVRGRGFDPRTVQIFGCMNLSVCIGFGRLQYENNISI